MANGSRATAVRLRRTALADIPWVTALEAHPDNAPYVTVWSQEQHARALSDPDVLHLVLEREARARAGYLILADLSRTDRVLQLMRVVVADKGAGLGRACVQAAKRIAADDYGATRLWLDVRERNARARALYESEGFRHAGQSPSEPGLLVMAFDYPAVRPAGNESLGPPSGRR